MNEMINHNTENNDDDDTRTNSEGISLGGCPIAQQDWISRHRESEAKKIVSWGKYISNKCYCRSDIYNGI